MGLLIRTAAKSSNVFSGAGNAWLLALYSGIKIVSTQLIPRRLCSENDLPRAGVKAFYQWMSWMCEHTPNLHSCSGAGTLPPPVML